MSDLLTLWDGVDYETNKSGIKTIRAALLCVGCDLPAGRKVCGFLSFCANLGCTRCCSNFGTGIFGRQDYSGFDRSKWIQCTNEQHRKDVDEVRKCSTITAKQSKESELGCRYSCLLQLPYFDPIRMLVIDPMHNLYLGTAKFIFSGIWLKKDFINPTLIDDINSRISSLVVPPEVRFGRLPACLDYPSSLTAEQWMLWVNYYSVFVN